MPMDEDDLLQQALAMSMQVPNATPLHCLCSGAEVPADELAQKASSEACLTSRADKMLSMPV